MAIFNRINQHSKFVGGVIAIGLLLFILGNEFFGPNSFFRKRDNNVGEIADNTISADEYLRKVQEAEQDYTIRSGRNITENERTSIQEQAWNELVIKYAYQPEFDKLGLAVTDEELTDMVQGKNIHPTIRQLFSNPQTQQFDKTFLKDFLANFDKRPPQDQQLWLSVEKSLSPDRVRNKYVNLFKLTNYVTKAEAKREYTSQTAKAQAKFVYVPFYSIPDSTIKISDDEIKDYISKYKDRYEVEDGKTIDYVIFPVSASSKDSAIFRKELQDLTQEFKTTDNDSLFVLNNSDVPSAPRLVSIGELPEELKTLGANLQFDSVYGPYSQGGKYILYKVLGSKNDTTFSARASHILFKGGETPEAKAAGQKQANEILSKIKGGASFEDMARQYGTDGTASRGGDLGWFQQGQMVKKFNDAVFNASNKGLLPSIVETEFGYHIIKVTEPKTNKKYELATVEREIVPTEETKDIAFKKADQFATETKDTAAFNASVKKLPGLSKLTAKNVRKTDRYISGVSQPKEIIKWAYQEGKVGQISPVFSLDNSYVVAIVTGERKKGTASVEDVKDEVSLKLRNEKKGIQIIDKLKGLQGGLDQIASKYGDKAIYNTAGDITLGSNTINGLGYDPTAVGKLFGLQKGKRSEPFQGESGVAIVELVELTPAPEIADYTAYKTQLLQQKGGREEYLIDEAIRKNAEIEDERYKFF